ncbi:Probable serine/threonine-protein kinase DDB_G0277449 [Durusdinium trenchii]
MTPEQAAFDDARWPSWPGAGRRTLRARSDGSHLSEESFVRGQDRPTHRMTLPLPACSGDSTALEMAVLTEGRGTRVAPTPEGVRLKRHSWAGSLKNWIGFEDSRESESVSGDFDMPVELNEVAVVQAEKEWGGGDSSSDSSSSELAGWRQRRPPPANGLSAASTAPTPAGGAAGIEVPVQVVQVEKEWGGADSDDSEDGATSVAKAGEARRRQLAQREEALAAAVSETFSMKAQGPPAEPGPTQPPSRAPSVTSEADTGRGGRRSRRASVRIKRTRSFRTDFVKRCWGAMAGWYAGFLAFTLLHATDCILRIISIYFYASYGLYVAAFAMLTPIQVIGSLLSIYITFHDADVLLILHHSSGWQKFLFFFVSFLFLGCCQLIQVKRAWSRQLHSPEVVLDMDDPRPKADAAAADRAADAQSLPDFGAAERITPVALVTGIPFLLVHWISATRYVERSDGWPLFWWCTAVVLLVNVSLGMVDIDVSVSSYVVRRYQSHSAQEGQWPICVQRLFKPLHLAFRITEVWMRLLVLAGLMQIRYELFNRDDVVLSLTVVIDYAIGVNLLFRNAPEQEGALVHIFAGIGLLTSDCTHFIDLPNFALAARRISRRLAWLRFAQVLLLLGLYHWVFWNKSDVPFGAALHSIRWIYVTSIVYYLMRYSLPIRRVGSDLHTASLDGNLDLVKALLKPDQNGQVLDINAASKDGQSMTPLMLAAQCGHVDVMEELLRNGAKVGARTQLREDTALHFAASSRKVEACQMLIRHAADIDVRNRKGQKPLQVAMSLSLMRRNELIQLLTSGLPAGDEGSFAASNTSVSGKKRATYYSVKAKPVAGLQLKSLFPNLEEDDTPSPRVLQSVSSLVVSKAAGPLGRRALMHEENSGSVPLGALRRVRELGRGGFGRVIEVELPRDAASSIWRRPRSAQRFALKLQLKQDHRQASSEVLALQRAEHPFIVHLHRAFAFDKYLALLLELCPTDLNRLLCEEPGEEGRYLGLAPDRVALYLGQVMLALAYLHESDIVYRDVKPENILINTRNEAKLTDFGLAKVVTSAERMTMCGTMGFLSPELTGGGAMTGPTGDSEEEEDGDPTPEFNPFKTDAYSFGVTLQVSLLGEDGARRKTVKRKGPMMLPLHLSEQENADMLAQLKLSQRLSEEAFHLLVEKLLPFSQARRFELKSPEVKNHPFFQKELNCTNVEEFLLSNSGAHNYSSVVMSPSVMGWSP